MEKDQDAHLKKISLEEQLMFEYHIFVTWSTVSLIL